MSDSESDWEWLFIPIIVIAIVAGVAAENYFDAQVEIEKERTRQLELKTGKK